MLFDLDGVVTEPRPFTPKAPRTVRRRAARRPQRTGEDHSPFAAADYRHYVDGKPRADGIRDFLAARGITLPEGRIDDDGDATVSGLATRKQRLFDGALADGIHPFDSTIALVRQLQAAGVRTAVYSASRNCRNAARRRSRGSVRRPGGRNDARTLGFANKPDPAMLLEATHRLAVRTATLRRGRGCRVRRDRRAAGRIRHGDRCRPRRIGGRASRTRGQRDGIRPVRGPGADPVTWGLGRMPDVLRRPAFDPVHPPAHAFRWAGHVYRVGVEHLLVVSLHQHQVRDRRAAPARRRTAAAAV